MSNPLGMQGRLARAYGHLIDDLYRQTTSTTAPWDLKQTLGSQINRFAGYNQQDSAELVSYLLDLMHEDLNRVIDKPYTEIGDL